MIDPELKVSLKTSDIDILHEVATSLHAAPTLDGMLNNVLARIKKVFGVEGASIALHDSDQHCFFFIRTIEQQNSRNHDRPAPGKWKFPDNYGVAGWVFQHRKSVRIDDVSRDERFTNTLDIQKNLDTRSMLCVPLRTRKKFLGVLYAINSRDGMFTEKSQLLLEILSGTIAIAIENARLYGELKVHAETLESENIRLKAELQKRFNKQGIIASSQAMQKVFALLDKVIVTTTTVLIQGETGTGKELIARAIHYNGPLKERPFIAENCAALSESLLESELFGHVKGAYTGAISNKKGLFEQARGGTVFLDEIADMPLSMQSKLLRVIQEGCVRPVGGSSAHQISFRLIAATNRNLHDEVEKGNFRKDLFYRIHAFPILLPPLRERKEDIPLLAAFFLRKYTKKFAWPEVRLAPDFIDLLTHYDWPGNIRELEHEIERALTLAGRGNNLNAVFLSERIRGTAPERDPSFDTQTTLPDAVSRLERMMVRDALEQTQGNRSQAARILGLTRQGLLNKIARYGLAEQ
ncbi:MAG: GAF domain-containing protein [Deltaproteobacteria bacterium]|nr:GAF domain-containing protein [Deltaproteobacteria bacterium]